jgi:hypothetical protein
VRSRIPPALVSLRLPVFPAVLAFVFFAPAVSAQSLWLPHDGSAVMVEALKPSLEGSTESFSTAALYASVRVCPHGGASFVGEIPFAHAFIRTTSYGYPYGVPYSSYYRRGSTFGNPYVGAEIPLGRPFFVEIGTRLPGASNRTAQDLGRLADAARREAFDDRGFSLRAALNVREVGASGVMYRLRLAPILRWPDSGPDAWAMSYAWQIGYEGPALRLGSAVSGSVPLSDTYGSLGERMHTQIEAHADFGGGALRPGLEMRLPLGAAARVVPVVLGASLTFAPQSGGTGVVALTDGR